jgi:hypothetical protein
VANGTLVEAAAKTVVSSPIAIETISGKISDTAPPPIPPDII